MLTARLIADDSDLDSRLAAARAALDAAGIATASAVVADAAEHCVELALVGDDPLVAARILGVHFDAHDLLVASDTIEVPHLFVSDMDSTMIGQECIDELADFAGLKPQVAAITERAMQGELDFPSALRERVALLEGLDEAAIATCLSDRIRPEPGARELVATLKAHGCRTVLVTGGFHHFADPVAGMLGFERVVGNRLAVAGGRLSGALAGPISDAATKLATLEEERGRLGANARVLASGDGANDIPMLAAADYGFAYRAKPKARDAANGRVEAGDLTAILTLLGIARRDWTAE